MPLFEYDCVDARGKKRSGVVEAVSDKDAKAKLREQGVLITKLKEKTHISSRQQLHGESLIAFTVQLSQLVNAGVPLYESLMAIEEQDRNESYHRIILSICEQVRAGSSLSEAMSNYPESFDTLYCGMVAAGEAIGALGPVVEKLSQFLNRQMKVKKQITTAMIYPLILGCFSLLIIALLLGFVVPSLEGIFADRPMNAFTSLVMSFSHFFRGYWWLYLPVGISFGCWAAYKIRSPGGRLWIERNLLRVPVIKTLIIQTAVARFCRTLSTLLQGGLSMIDALRISRGVIKNVVLENEILTAETRIIEGKSLSQELKRSPYFPQLVSRMLAVGEESGTSVVMLSRVAEMYEQEIEKTLDRVMALAQPVILIFMGLVIGTVLLAILIPLTDVSSFSIAS